MSVVPAKAGTQCRSRQSHWIPACAGMTAIVARLRGPKADRDSPAAHPGLQSAHAYLLADPRGAGRRCTAAAHRHRHRGAHGRRQGIPRTDSAPHQGRDRTRSRRSRRDRSQARPRAQARARRRHARQCAVEQGSADGEREARRGADRAAAAAPTAFRDHQLRNGRADDFSRDRCQRQGQSPRLRDLLPDVQPGLEDPAALRAGDDRAGRGPAHDVEPDQRHARSQGDPLRDAGRGRLHQDHRRRDAAAIPAGASAARSTTRPSHWKATSVRSSN